MHVVIQSFFKISVLYGLSIMLSCNLEDDQNSGSRIADSSSVVLDSQIAVKPKMDFDTVQNESKISPVQNASGLVVYLTFDDGPYHTTPSIVKLFKSKGVKASFFIVGSQRDRIPEYDTIYRNMETDTLFRFYNHTYSHAITFGRIRSYYSKPDSVLADLERNRQYITPGSNHIRLPGKNTWWTSHRIRMDFMTKPVIDGLVESGSKDRIIGWDVSWKNTEGRLMVDSLVQKIVKISKRERPFQNHVVVLCHDYQFRSKESLSDLSYLIDVLIKKHKCVFAWADEFPR